MKRKRKVIWPAMAAVAVFAAAPLARGAIMHDVTGWVVHNGTSTLSNPTTNSPTFERADDNVAGLGTFPEVHLANDGDFIKVTTTLTFDEPRDGCTGGINCLNGGLRFGVFGGPAGNVVAEDTGHRGVWIEYHIGGGNVREADPAQTAPFTNPIDEIGNMDPDAEGDALQGASIDPVDFELTLTRNSGNLVVTGQISGTDSVSGNPFLSKIDPALVHAPVASGFNFDFNRAGFDFAGGNVNAPKATLHDVTVTTNVPEPSSCLLAAGLALAGVVVGRRRGHAPQ
jgi:hypothetical protein